MRYWRNLQEPGFAVGNMDILNVSREGGYRYSYRNGRTKHGFIYTIRGRMQDEFVDPGLGTVQVGAGQMIFIPKDCAYVGVYQEEETEIKIVQFDLTEGNLPEYLSRPTLVDLPNAGELIEAFFQPTMNHPFYYLSCLFSLLWQVDVCFQKMPAKYRKLQPALTQLNQYSEENEKISAYAENCGMSEVNFRRLFREYTGKSPVEYRNDIRLENARRKLLSGEYNVSEAAESSGFSNLSFFTRLYKRKFGYTPKNE